MIYIDANIFIYSVLDKGDKGKMCKKILTDVALQRLEGCTSPLTWDEVVYTLKKHAPIDEVISQSKEFLKFPNLNFLSTNEQVLNEANELWIKHGLKPRDAIQAATAILNNCKEIISDDSDFDKIRELKRIKIK